MDKPYPKSHVMMIMGLNIITFVIGLALMGAPFAKGWFPGDIDTTTHVGFGALIATLAIFRALLGYGSIWLDIVLIALGVFVFMLPKIMHKQYPEVAAYNFAHIAGGLIIVAVAVVSMLATLPVIRRMRAATV
jgi:hypothetical protein